MADCFPYECFSNHLQSYHGKSQNIGSLDFCPPAVSRPQNRVQIFRRTPMASQSSRFAFSHFQREATDRVNRLPKLRTPHDNQCDNNTELISSLVYCLSRVELRRVFPSWSRMRGAGGKHSAQTTRACGRVRSLRAHSTRRIPSSETRTTNRGA